MRIEGKEEEVYQVDVQIKGVAPLLQNKFGQEAIIAAESVKKRTGEIDWSQEWRDKMYLDEDGYLVQPGEQIIAAMAKAATAFRIKGRGKKTYKDMVKASIFIDPERISHGMKPPNEPSTNDPNDVFTIDVRRVVIRGSAVLRARPRLNQWGLAFMLQVMDDQFPEETVKAILDEAGEKIGIGDFRPRFGRFIVTRFDKME